MNSFVDLTYNQIVRNFIHVYTDKKRDKLQQILGLKDYYFPMFERVLDSYQLPIELKYMAVIESALNPNAVSRAGATGLWQLMYGTAKLYDLTINTVIDERRDPLASTHAAARYLKDLYNMYHDWPLVIAAYNCGPGNVNRAIRRSGGKTDYWEVYYSLPRETRGYVPAFIAAMYAMKYHHKHHIRPDSIAMPEITDTIHVNRPLHFQQVANVLNIPLQQVKHLNPQYRRNIIPAGDKTWPLRLPFQFTGKFVEMSDSVYAYKDSVYFTDYILKNPERYSRSYHKHTPPSGNYSKVYYTVKSGDNLGYIAEWFDVRASDIRYWNNIRGNLIRKGEKLLIYVPRNKKEYYQRINRLSFSGKQRLTGAPVESRQENASSPKTRKDGKYIYYKVRYGDTIWDIARKFPGVSDNEIIQLNDLDDASELKAGQLLRIKKKS
jgi:membrane-bound lytic murein transglycosylase D